MANAAVSLTGIERTFGDDEIIVTKTDPRGRITYANDVFLRMSGYTESELLDRPHNIIRHPDMPRCIFKTLWDTIESGNELFAYVVNRAKNGDHYWVFAHVTPTFDADGKIIRYHSSRRSPSRSALAKILPLYEQLVAEESRHADGKAGIAASSKMMADVLTRKGVFYDEFVQSL